MMGKTERVGDSGTPAWWGEFDLTENSALIWRIGPLTLAVVNESCDWVVAVARGDDPVDPSLEPARALRAEALPPELERIRFALEKPRQRLRLQPRLADRPVSVRPELPVSVPSGQSVTFYISTPVWLRLTVQPRSIFLTEVPTFRPSDSWFGSTQSGELCYGTRTRAVLRRSELDQPAHRAITPVRVVNKAPEALDIDRLKLPLPNLALYRGEDGGLFTQSVEFVRESAGDSAVMRLSRGERGGQQEPVDEARIRLRQNRVIKTFDWALSRVG